MVVICFSRKNKGVLSAALNRNIVYPLLVLKRKIL